MSLEARINRTWPRVVLVGFLACNCACDRTSTVSLSGHLADTIVRLSSGDSVEFQATGPAIVPGKAPGMMITYRPFFSLADTLRIHAVALEFFRTLLPQLPGPPPFVVMKAVDIPAATRNQGGVYRFSAFGVVLERHSDGRWYGLGAAIPALPDSL